MNATTVAIDLAKDVFELAYSDGNGRIVERKRVNRKVFGSLFDNRAPLRIVTEACGSAHYWGRLHGARSALAAAKGARNKGKPVDKLRTWALDLAERVGHNKAAVALANKLARRLWCRRASPQGFRPQPHEHPTANRYRRLSSSHLSSSHLALH